ncbi:MAG: hypothetical protein LLG01_02095 [Planctomycetaceae bacterium]|nr:hypothetical protein [Planctomycetaceae bacterium]
MTWAKSRFWVVAGLFLVINIAALGWIAHRAGRAAGAFRIVSVTPRTHLDAADRLAVVFSEPMVKSAALNVPLERSPLEIQPPIAGRWQWAGYDRLEFLPEQPFPVGRRFKLSPAAMAEQLLGGRLVGISTFDLTSGALAVVNCSVVRADREAVDIEIEFNQDVDPRHLIDRLEIRDGEGAVLRPRCLVQTAAKNLPLRVPHPRKGWMTVRIDPALAGAGAQISMASAFSTTLKVQWSLTIQKAAAETPSLDKDIDITLMFSQALDTAQPMPQLNVSPEVKDLRVSWKSPRYDSAISALCLSAAFQPGLKYRIEVPAGVRNANGTELSDKQTLYVEVPHRSPSLNMPNSRGVLSPQGNMLLELKTVNVPAVQIKTARVYSNNLVPHLVSYYGQWSRPQAEKTVALDTPIDQPTTVALDLAALTGRTPGIYTVEVHRSDSRWDYERGVVAVTDLGITAKRVARGFVVWVTSLRTAKPVAGAKVTAISRNNQVLGAGATSPEGLATLNIAHDGPDGPAFVITAEVGEDMAYLQPQDRPWVVEGVDQSGRAAPQGYDVMLYAERGVYRPGETIHLTGIVRDLQGQAPPAFPLSLKVIRPDGHRAAEMTVQFDANAQGVFHGDFTPPSDGQTGAYTCDVTLPGSDNVLGSTSPFVESFVPVRMEVKAKADREVYHGDQPIKISASARYLFGQPAANLPVKAMGKLGLGRFTSKQKPQYVFGDSKADRSVDLVEVSEALDANGQASLTLQPKGGEVAGNPKGWWKGSASVTVTEPGGRSVSANVPIVQDTAGRYVGLAPPASNIVPSNSPVSLEWVQVNADDTPAAPGDLTYNLSRIEYDWTVEAVSGSRAWKTVERLIEAKSGRLVAGQPHGQLTLQFPQAGNYRLSVIDVISGSETVIYLYAAWADEDTRGFTVNRPGMLEVVLDKPKYAPGGTAHVLVRSPFAGTMLLTVEAQNVLEHRLVELKSKSAELDLPVSADLRGGAFIAATVVRAIDPESDKWLPMRAMGLARLEIDSTPHKMPLTIEAPASALPGKKVRVTVRTAPPAEASRPGMVHLWAVDEGILLTSAFATPDPLERFFAHRKLDVISSDIFTDLLPDNARPKTMARIGADAAARHRRRTEATPVRVRKSAVIWRRAVPVGPDGVVSAELDLPDLSTEMRLMAVGVDGDLYGAARKPLKVASPLMVQTSWPRFVSPGDTFTVPVKVFNTTDGPVKVQASVEISGPVTLSGNAAPAARKDAPRKWTLGELALPPQYSKTIWLEAVAAQAGQITARTLVQAQADLDAHDEMIFTCRAATNFDAITKLAAVEAGKPQHIAIDTSAMLPGTARTVVSLSGRSGVQLRSAIDQLIDYPYGCVEQTTSRLYAMLYAPALLAPDDSRAINARALIDSGVARLWSMQTRDGGLAYWPGGDESSAWGTAYAAAFLARARQAGVAIDKRFSGELVRYLQTRLRRALAEETSANEQALCCYALAALGSPEISAMNRLQERIDALDIGGRADLAAAWLAVGRRDMARAVLPEETITQTITATTGGRITSQRVAQANLLGVLLDLDAQHPWIPLLADRVNKARTQGYWGTTVENAACVAALARYESTIKEGAGFTGTAAWDGGQVDFTHAKTTAADVGPADRLNLTTTGSGTIFVTMTTEGLAKTPPAPYDRQLEVRRAWHDRQGKVIDPAKLRVGDTVRVSVTCRALGDANFSLENVAVVDALPGGFEVENPVLKTSAAAVQASGIAPPTGAESPTPPADHIEFRDDRVLIFTDVNAKPRTFTYTLRAITSGKFALPPVQASCMYDSGFASVHGAGAVEIAK